MDGCNYIRSGISFLPLRLEEKRTLQRLFFRQLFEQEITAPSGRKKDIAAVVLQAAVRTRNRFNPISFLVLPLFFADLLS